MYTISSVFAEIEFVPPATGRLSRFDYWAIEGNRRVCPESEAEMYYLPDAKFDEDPFSEEYIVGLAIEWQWISADAKSAKIRFGIRVNDDGAWSYLLHPGSRFKLYDGGTHLVARGIVTSEIEAFSPIIIRLGLARP